MATYDPNFRITNTDQDPTWLVDLEWITPASDFAPSTILETNNTLHLTNNTDFCIVSTGIATTSMYTPNTAISESAFFTNELLDITNDPAFETATGADANSQNHLTNSTLSLTAFAQLSPFLTISEYQVHRSTSPGFTPGPSTLIATLSPSAPDTIMTYQDTDNPLTDTEIFYQLESIFA